MDAPSSWSQLDAAWQVAFEEAWISWKSGSVGIGAAITQDDGAVVARGRNRQFDVPDGSSPLAGTYMAHAEMNVLASLPAMAAAGDSRYPGFVLTVTFEPCPMCLTTTRTYRIPKIRYAADDPVWDGVDAMLRAHPATAHGLPEREVLLGPLSAFAHVLHLTRLLDLAVPQYLAANSSLAKARVEIATDASSVRTLETVAAGGGSVADAIESIWTSISRL
jgi:tRNA(Arg) A34 adenosine deaminase TadA